MSPPQLSNREAVFSPLHTRMLLLGLALATGMEFYTFDSMNLVLVDIAGTLGVTTDEASWLLTIYSSSLLLGIPISIWAAGHFGHKRFLMASIGLYAVSAFGCALSPTFGIMLAWRAIQGAAGAGLVVWWRASVYLLLPKAQRSSSLMRISTGLYLASAAGLLLSGYVTDHFNWRLIFLPNLILAAGAIWILSKEFPDLPPTQSERLQHTDWAGLILLAAWTICLQFILSRGSIDDWFGSPRIRFLAWSAAVSFIGFVFWQLSPHNRRPLLDIRLLANRNVMASAFIGICLGMILSGSLFVLPRFLRYTDSQTHSATQTGQLVCIYALAAAACRPIVTPMIARFGPRRAVIFSIGMLILAMFLLNRWLTTGTSDGYYVLPLICYGLCVSPLLPAVGGGTIGKMDQKQLMDGVSLYMTFRQFGASLGVALVTIVINQRDTLHSSRLFEHLRQSSIQTQIQLSATGHYLASRLGHDTHGAALRLLQVTGTKQATTLSDADAFLFMTLVGLVALCFVPLISPAAGLPGKPAKNPPPTPAGQPTLAGQTT